MAQPTNTRSRQRKPAIASKRGSMQPTSNRSILADLDSFAETEDEKRSWKRFVRNLGEQAKNFDLEASVKKLRHLSLLFDGANNAKKRIKYQLLGEVYKQYMMALAGGNLLALMNLYRDDGMIIHRDVHPILAIIRANITTERDYVTRWGSALRYARKKQIPPEELIKFLKENGIERSCKEFRKLQAQARLAVVKDGGERAETSLEEMDAEINTTKTSARYQLAKPSKKVAGKASDQTPIETTTDFDVTFRRITRNRKDVFVNIDGHVSADGRLSLQTVRIAHRSLNHPLIFLAMKSTPYCSMGNTLLLP